jgi:D-serine deaminase-like pyridoxal phosphate-dependent protein
MPIRENKFSRQAEQLVRHNNSGESQATIDQQLARLDEDIRRLKIEYDIFFNGGVKRAPYETKNRVETVIKRLADERSLTFAQRYQYNALVARFTSFKELWRRTMQGREEGRDAASLARAAQNLQTENFASTEREIQSKTFSCANVERESETVGQIYEALVQAKRICGEKNELPFDRFRAQLAAQTERFKQNAGCERVSYEIGVENGRVTFKAKAQ